ncbi:MAG: DUF4224 domain-containing protein [Magnetococcales bacterium]|nr:DUF4224 domain-containing protein [Magnetococcales bacterium]
MLNIFLTKLEVQQLTGFHSVKRIKEHLDGQGIKYFENRFGWPLVSREYLSKVHLPVNFEEKNNYVESPFALAPDFSGLT